jgi:NADH-ubiquinone oxidoreductase chain 5
MINLTAMDMGLSIGFFAMFALFGSLDYATVFSLAPFMNETAITIIGLLLLTGALAKSAQIPLHSWLPGSMEGPTPVSALIHAATLVTAGLYLLVRSSPILEFSPTSLLIITLIGSTTAFIAALCGLVQNDIKRIIAFSTISQLGYMVLAVGLSKYDVSLFHVINHAFFKALLFLSAGSVIHSMADQQDIRRLGGLINFLPFTYTIMLIGSLSLLATPWLSGFFSKDLIIELGYAQYGFSGYYAYILGSLTAGLTAFYSFRLISLTFLTYPNAKRIDYLNSHEASISVIVPLTILALFSIFFGYVFSDLFVGMASDFLSNSVYVKPDHITLIEAEFSLPILIKLLPAILSLIGATLGLFVYHQTPDLIISLTDPSINASSQSILKVLLRNLYTLLNSKFLFDILYNKYIISGGLKLGYIISKTLDKGLIELIGPYGLSNTFFNTGKKIAKLDTGLVTTYSLYFFLGLLILLFLIFAPMYFFSINFIESGDSSYNLGMERIFIIYFVTLLLILTY